MAAQGWVGFNVNYRLSPFASFPDHLVDVKRGLAWIREHAEDYGVDPDFICVTGGSAGGHLAALMALTQNDPTYQPGFEDADTSLAAAVPFYGVYDFTPPTAPSGADPRVYSLFLERWVMKAFVADEPGALRRRVAAPPRARRCPAVLRDPRRQRHAGTGGGRPGLRRARSGRCRPTRSPTREMQGAEHAFEVFPSARTAKVIEGVERFLTTIWEHGHRSTPAVEAELADVLTD